ncbi:hypothetical protein KUTeg_022111 [Tegillarca granosa]|uniref:Uncharacterized protein n=1 Tax=Tegillarca granosa TaxID=220873 RepID=A0ABQ9E5N3_TEGGR|nr:hypothetical protein KUTeg_022111 [Tegillarca granosa]
MHFNSANSCKIDLKQLDRKLLTYPDDVDSLVTKGDEAKYKEYSFSKPSTSVVSMTVDIRNQSLYYLDVDTRTIYRNENFSVTMEKSEVTGERIQVGVSRALCRIAFDWISHNIYWTDRYHNWIAVRPVFSNDTLMYKVILQDQIVVPIGLAVDPVSGYLFWSDTMPSGRIERSNLLGEDRTVLISDSVGFPTAIAIDRVERRIYWTDFTRFTIERVSYDGQNRKVLHRKNGQPFADIFIYKTGN